MASPTVPGPINEGLLKTTPFLTGPLQKMVSEIGQPVIYQLAIGDSLVPMADSIGKKICFKYHGEINCCHCGRPTKKSFNQGFCYPCFKTLASCDRCIMSPELCHYQQGTCREPKWGESFCMTPHYVYLANSSGIKVGITRASQIPTRWIDQGAIQGLMIARVASRFIAGQLEVIFKSQVADKTNWRVMLKGQIDQIDLIAQRDRLIEICKHEINKLPLKNTDIEWLQDEVETIIEYPVREYPVKVTPLSFDKTASVEGTLMGIKGQYLLLDTGVLNIRKHTSYHVDFFAA